MSQVEESTENILQKVESLLKNDEDIRRAREQHMTLLNDINTHPYYHFFAGAMLRQKERRVRTSLFLVFRHLYGGKGSSGNIQWASLEDLEADALIARILYFLQQEGKNRTIVEVERWLIRIQTLLEGLILDRDYALAVSLLDRPTMPPFETREEDDRNRRAREELRRNFKEKLENPETRPQRRIATLWDEMKEGRPFTPQMMQVMAQEAFQDHVSQLVASNFSQFRVYRENFVLEAESSPETFQNKYNDLLWEYAECILTHEVASVISIVPMEGITEVYEDALRATKRGAEWVLDSDGRLENLLKQLRSERRRLLLKIHTWLQVHEAMKQSDDPRQAIEPARITKEKGGKEKRTERLQETHDILLANPSLREGQGRGEWKNVVGRMDGIETSFANYRQLIGDMAKDCFGVEKKPDRYEGFSGGFARLVQELWDGTWVDHA